MYVRISIRVGAYKYMRMCVYIYAYMRIHIRVCAYKNAYSHTYAYICVCSLVFMSWCIVFLLLEEKLDSTKKLHDYELHEDVSQCAVASVDRRVRKHVLNNINGLSFSKRNFHE